MSALWRLYLRPALAVLIGLTAIGVDLYEDGPPPEPGSILAAMRESAKLAEAQVDLNKTTIRAGVAGRVEQFTLRVGDVVNPVMRSAGILIPAGAGAKASALVPSPRGERAANAPSTPSAMYQAISSRSRKFGKKCISRDGSGRRVRWASTLGGTLMPSR